MGEAQFADRGSGLAPTSEGWFVINVADAEWLTTEGGERRPSGSECPFESAAAGFGEVGVRIHVLPPGEPNGLYHGESQQEDFLVIAGECILLVEGEERRLKQWDFFHSPAWTQHIFIGAGEEPCVIFMVGSRTGQWNVRYPVSELAARHAASVERETTSSHEAYTSGSFEPSRRARPSYWASLPWS